MPESRKAAREAKRKARRKAKAEKAYSKTYGSDSSGSNNPRKAASGGGSGNSDSDGGPRAALYKGKMGSSQKKSSKMQSKTKSKSAKAPKPKSGKAEKGRGAMAAAAGKLASVQAKAPSVSLSDKTQSTLKRFAKPLAAVAVLALFVVALYGPAQQYYVQMRETDRLEAEYAAVSQRNDSLQSEIDSLKTDEGVEDRAHEDLGYVKSGEETASVKGIEIDSGDEGFSSNVTPGSVPAPETWYSPVLDVLFGYSR